MAGGCADWLCPPATTAPVCREGGPSLEPIVAEHRSHYDMLGIEQSATAAEIRAAYRDLARRLHPDRAAPTGGGEMAAGRQMSAVNEAYRVLSDPARRALYDRSLAATAPPEPGSQSAPAVDDEPRRSRDTVLSPSGPARVPWKLMLVLAVLGSAAVLASTAFDGPAGEQPPDGILQLGSCIELEDNGDAREVACTGDASDVVVETMVPLGDSCPVGAAAHRDRLGMVTVCIPED